MPDKQLLQTVLNLTRQRNQKVAYAPPMPPAQDPTGAMTDPAMQAMGGGMSAGAPPPPMGGAMPPPPGGAMPPPGQAVDPMGGMGGAPMGDPSMGMGMPPPPGGMPPGTGMPGEAGVPVMLSGADLQALIEMAAQGGAGGAPPEEAMPPPPAEEEADASVTNVEIQERIGGLEDMLGQLMGAMGITQAAPPTDVGAEPAEDMGLGGGAVPDAFAGMGAEPGPGGMPGPAMGMPPEAMPPEAGGMPPMEEMKVASQGGATDVEVEQVLARLEQG